MMKRVLFTLGLAVLSLHVLVAQSETDKQFDILLLRDTTVNTYPSLGLTPKEFQKPKGSLQINGFYRFFATYTRQMMPYTLTSAPGDTVLPRSLFIGDDAQLPNLLLNVSQTQCNAVVLQFAHIHHGFCGQGGFYPVKKGIELFLGIRIGQTLHRNLVRDGGKLLGDRTSHPQGGAIGICPFRIGAFQGFQFSQKAIEFFVADGRLVFYVIPAVVGVQFIPQMLDAKVIGVGIGRKGHGVKIPSHWALTKRGRSKISVCTATEAHPGPTNKDRTSSAFWVWHSKVIQPWGFSKNAPHAINDR
jgi:hypothetical protein